MMFRIALLSATLFTGIFGAGGASAVTVYSNDFQSGSTAGFTLGSGVAVQTAPDGTTKFLGYLAQGSDAALNLSGLPAHTSVVVSFDLYTLGTLDGGLKGAAVNCCGPDFFTLKYGAATVFSSTFSNIPGTTQDFPAPGDNTSTGSPAQTGAIATGQFGFNIFNEATYHISFTAADSASVLAVDFIGDSSQGWPDEGFGLGNVQVDLITNVTENAVPEPASLALFGAALTGLGLIRRRR